MSMKRLKMMKEQLVNCVQSQLGDIKNVDAKELGEAIDMIKDLEEAMYYCTITKAMTEESEQGQKGQPHHENMPVMYFNERYIYPPYYDRDMDRHDGRMYYQDGYDRDPRTGRFMSSGGDRRYYDGQNGSQSQSGNNNSNTNTSGNPNYSSQAMSSNGTRQYHEREYPIEMRDAREGKSPMMRRYYMEGKESHSDKSTQMKHLEKYMQELSQDILEMIQNASQEERQLLQNKIQTLSVKIGQLNG